MKIQCKSCPTIFEHTPPHQPSKTQRQFCDRCLDRKQKEYQAKARARRKKQGGSMKKVAVFLVAVLLLSGCASLSGYDQVKYQRLQIRLQKCDLPELKPKSSATAGALNILPGIGNAYLKQWGLFACNLLLWPYSILWGVPQAAADADNYNKAETLTHYYYGFGKEELDKPECKE